MTGHNLELFVPALDAGCVGQSRCRVLRLCLLGMFHGHGRNVSGHHEAGKQDGAIPIGTELNQQQTLVSQRMDPTNACKSSRIAVCKY